MVTVTFPHQTPPPVPDWGDSLVPDCVQGTAIPLPISPHELFEMEVEKNDN